MRLRRTSSFVRKDESIIREPTLSTIPPSSVGIDMGGQPGFAAEAVFQDSLQFAVSGVDNSRADVTSAAISPRCRASSCSKLAITSDRMNRRRFLASKKYQFAGQFGGARLHQHGFHARRLLFARNNRRANQLNQVRDCG